MYPTLADFLRDIFGTFLPVKLYAILNILNTFGLMLALSFIAGSWILKKELIRLQQNGKLPVIKRTSWIGKPLDYSALAYNALAGFILGFKLGFLLTNFNEATANFGSMILSKQGNWWLGIIGAVAIAYWYYNDNKKQQLPEPKEVSTTLTPGEMIGEIVIRAAIGGLLGAKIFHLLEYWSDFMADPAGMFFSRSGLTFYGGLLLGAAAVIHWVVKNKMPFHVMADAVAPSLILAYGIGRLGCQLAGDGDWGIYNTAYVSEPTGKIVMASDSSIQKAFMEHEDYFVRNFGSIQAVPSASFKGPEFLPNWLFAYNYPHNVGSEGVLIENCQGEHCGVLPIPVFPTPLYEIIMCLSIFGFLWVVRKKFAAAGMLMAVYMIFNGAERFTIELIRVNSFYHFWGIKATQAEIIALVLVFSGILYYALLYQKSIKKTAIEA
jgi:prolipoprotein diacylglyceryltransferase